MISRIFTHVFLAVLFFPFCSVISAPAPLPRPLPDLARGGSWELVWEDIRLEEWQLLSSGEGRSRPLYGGDSREWQHRFSWSWDPLTGRLTCSSSQGFWVYTLRPDRDSYQGRSGWYDDMGDYRGMSARVRLLPRRR